MKRAPPWAVVSLLLLLLLLLLGPASGARALPGFYVSSAPGPIVSERAAAVLMRGEDRVILSLQQEYRGPRADFALVLPVPATVGSDDVRILPAGAFEEIERLSAPRLVEFRQRDPCGPPARPRPPRADRAASPRAAGASAAEPPRARSSSEGYDVVVLGSGDSARLAAWLRGEGYRVPASVEAAARPYVEAGSRFAVVRADASRVAFDGSGAASPSLRLSYRSGELRLALRLGHLHADGPQDVVIHVLAPGSRYVAGNRQNVLVPTNLVMSEAARARFGEVYATILDRVYSRHRDAVVTEYAWDADRCEHCSTGPLGPSELDALGGDELPSARSADASLVLTRLRLRLHQAAPSDLTLRPAGAVAAGRGRPHPSGTLSRRIDRRTRRNAFQARYAILHGWSRPAACPAPRGGGWSEAGRRRSPAAIAARPGRRIIPTGRLRRFVHTWAPVLRIPARGDAPEGASVSD